MSGFRFQDPWWLLLLVPLAALGVWAIRRRGATVLYSDVSLIRSLPAGAAQRIKRLLPWVRWGGMALLVVALARPQRGLEDFRIRAEGIAMLMCIDRSGSMETTDYLLDGRTMTRLEVVRRVLRDFVAGKGKLAGRPDDLIGLIAFGGYAECCCPLTLDHDALLQVLDTVQVAQAAFNSPDDRILNRGVYEERLTAIGDALTIAVHRLKDVKAKSKVIVLLSDGKQTAGAIEPDEAAQLARDYGIKIYTVGLEYDEPTLKTLAEITGGRSFFAEDTKALQDVYSEIDRLEKSAAEGRVYTQYREWFPYPLVAGMGLVLLEFVLACTRFRSLT